MGRVIVHAGMGKTGSSSIQSWLGDQLAMLRDEAGVTVLKLDVGVSGGVRVSVPERGLINSNPFARHWLTHPEDRRRIMDELFPQLEAQARRCGTVVVSSEGLARPFFDPDEAFLTHLNELGSSHDVQVAYYVRPQHTALEASWRQWGFRRDETPAEHLTRHSQGLHHFRTYESVKEVAPRVMFAPRPFRRDLLHAGNVVTDFGRAFLGVEPTEDMHVWENPGLPLDVANALRSAPMGLIWRSVYDNATVERLKRFVGELTLPESPGLQLSRLILQQACHDLFEAENRRLISALGWRTSEWVPPVDADIGEASFERLNELWCSHANAAELMVLYHALARLLRGDAQDSEPGPGDEHQTDEAGHLLRELEGPRSRRSPRAGLRLSRALRPLLARLRRATR